MEMALKLTPALKRSLEFIARGGEHRRMVLQITASGGRASSQRQALRQRRLRRVLGRSRRSGRTGSRARHQSW
jgi:hypothetical protein